MKDRNKAYTNNNMDCYYSTSECKKHPSSSSSSGNGGICAYCLKERLLKLVCSDCGEQRLSSCSCSDEISSSNRNSCSVEVGSVGRVSFLIENEKNNNNEIPTTIKSKFQEDNDDGEDVMVLRRSSSIKQNGFWRIGKLFRKKNNVKNSKEKDCGRSVVGGFDEKGSEMLFGVSRSRSLCSFRGGGNSNGGGIFGSEDGGESVILSGARSSISAARSSGVNAGLILESGRRSGYSEAEPRRSGFDRDFSLLLDSENNNGGRKSGIMDVDGNCYNRRVFSLRESDFKGMDESSFIDFKLDNNSTLNGFGSMRGVNFMGHDVGDGVLTSGGSCRMSLNDRGTKRGRKSIKGWRWIFKNHSKNDQSCIN